MKYLKLISLTLLLIGISNQVQSQLIARWGFNNTFSDATGNYDLANYGASFTWMSIEGSYAVNFDGGSYYAKAYSVTLPDQFTITGWYKIWLAPVERPIMSNDTGSPLDGFQIILAEC